jgi:predicted RNA-binding protein YlqC (UPF0109 family)
MKELLEFLARGLVEQPDEVRVREVREDDGSVVLELSVAEDDYGNVIGRGGRTAQALLVQLLSEAVCGVDIERREIEIDLDFLGEPLS